MSAYQIFRLRNPALLMALAAAFPVIACAAGAANVDFATGAVTAVDSVGVQRPLSKGAEIGSGDTIRTGDGGRAQVRFSDGAMVSLQPQTEFRIDNYQYSGKSDGEEKGFFSLLKGGLRTITGLVGKAHRGNYKISTNVATIGIRGTEYSAVLDASGNELLVNTGEGQVEVCNDAGCIILFGGESGIVTGGRAPNRTESRPLLSPAQLGDHNSNYARGEDSRPGQRIVPASAPVVSVVSIEEPVVPVTPPIVPPIVPIPLVSGDANYVAFSGLCGGGPWSGIALSPGTNAVVSANVLMSFDGSPYSYSADVVKGGFSADGVIGWGSWSTGLKNASVSLTDFHYVVGIPTSSTDLAALGGLNATYNLIGFTVPTSSSATSPTIGNPTATFLANFPAMSLTLNLTVPVGGTPYTNVLTGSTSLSSANFSLSGASGSAYGFFAGANASHAGITYDIYTGSEDVMGALAFRR